jgi:hypothetical protein
MIYMLSNPGILPAPQIVLESADIYLVMLCLEMKTKVCYTPLIEIPVGSRQRVVNRP